MKILLIGYGKMGKEIEAIALKRGHTIAGKIDDTNPQDLQYYSNENTDVAIEFTVPEAAYDNLIYCLNNGIKVVCGTTGWLDKKPEVEAYTKKVNSAFFHASNFSIGVNIFFKLNEKLAEMMENFPEYNVEMEEIHHKQKKDKPSGTAVKLAEGIIDKLNRVDNWRIDKKDLEGTLYIGVKREENVPGIHKVAYQSHIDNITIQHTAYSREGFATGAVMAAEYIEKKNGIFTMEELLNLHHV